MRYAVRHRTTFDYTELVALSHHLLHLAPRDRDGQQCAWSHVQIVPAPTRTTPGTDYFGNAVHHVVISEPHRRLVVEANSIVDVEPSAGQGLPLDWPWADAAQVMEAPSGDALAAYEYTFPSTYVAPTAAVRDYASASFGAGRGLLEACADLTRRIYEEFEYRGGVSDVSTPVAQVLAMRQGVCQDFAHFAIACLRAMGLPARYVSGYLLTHPPPGQRKLVGADASHAWISVWAGRAGWVDFDPTNNVRPGDEHITVAWGRDYGDVSPISGLITGGGAHNVTVAVDVNPAPEAAAPA